MATNLCEKLISDNITASCTNPIYAGLGQRAYIFNKSDITSITYDVDETTQEENRFLLRGLTLKTGAKGYKIQNLGSEPFSGTTSEMEQANMGNKFNHTFVFNNENNDDTSAKVNTDIANGKFLVIFENDYEGANGNGKFEVYGSTKGCKCTGQSQPKYSTDTNGANTITLQEAGSPYQSQFFAYQGDNDDMTTEEYLDSLCQE